MKIFNIRLVFLLFVANSLYANIATFTAIKGLVDVEREEQVLSASTGMKVQERDTVATKDNSRAQIIFQDSTTVSIGKNSIFSVSEYLFEEESEPVAKFSMLQGAMRTITGRIGKVAPQKFMVDTRTVTIGIRGTNFTLIVDNDDIEAYCTHGIITANINSEVYNVKQGNFIKVLADGSFKVEAFDVNSLRKLREKHFKLKQQKSLQGNNVSEKSTEDDSQHLEMSYYDNSGSLEKSITEENSDNILNQENIATLGSVIAHYSMSDATYYGSYNTSESSGSLPASGDTKLSINFYNDSAVLELGNFKNENPDVTYNFYHVNSAEMEGHHIDSVKMEGYQVGGIGVADGTFFGPTGNTVKGKFSYSENEQITAHGAYDAITYETLH